MPRLPVADRLASLAIPAALVLLALAAGPAMAQVTQLPSVDTLMYNMEKDDGVYQARKAYTTAVHAAMLYTQCPAEYHVDDAKKARFNAELAKADRNYRLAYTSAHQKLTTKLPADPVNKAVSELIVKLQYDQALKIGKLIKSDPKNGCKQPLLERIDTYFERKYAYELQKQAAADAAEEKRRMEVPALNETPSQETKSH